MAVTAGTPIDLVREAYARFDERIDGAREHLGRPLTLAEKVLIAHLDDPDEHFERGETYNDLRPDRVAMQDATAQMALLQFMTAGLPNPAESASLFRAMADAGAKKVVVSSPHCYSTFKNDYPEFGSGFEAIHTSQFLAQGGQYRSLGKCQRGTA